MKIFISYRRNDDPYAARSINDALCKQFGKRNVYFDLDAIQAGLDFRQQVDDMVAQCDVMLVVIGDKWLQLDESGRSRLEDTDDLVSLEVSIALKRDIPVIPVLVGSATIPAEDILPEATSSLVFRQAIEVRATTNFDAQIDKLISSIEAVAPSGHSKLLTLAGAITFIIVATVIGWIVWQSLFYGKDGVLQITPAPAEDSENNNHIALPLSAKEVAGPHAAENEQTNTPSEDIDAPTQLENDEIGGLGVGRGVSYYYTFIAGPGEIRVVVDGKNEFAPLARAVAVTISDLDAHAILKILLGNTTSSQRVVKRVNIFERQRLIMRVQLGKATIDYQVRIEGAVDLEY